MKNTQELQKLHEVLTAQREGLILARKECLAVVSAKIAQNAKDPEYVRELMPTWMESVDYCTEQIQATYEKMVMIAEILY